MRIFLDTVGCRLNQAEIENMALQFRSAGHEIVATADGADLAIVNTCAVTAEAASDSRGKIRRASGSARLGAVVTGCWATLEPERAGNLPGVSAVVVNEHKDALVAEALSLPGRIFDLEPIARSPLPGLRHRTRAFIKVQDGCDNRCTFCITTVARGRSRSRSITEVLRDVRAALDGGTKEIVLTGVHLGSWGRDLGMDLKQLVREILDQTATPRLRLSSLEPWDLDARFFALWEDVRLCRQLHLPLQSGSAATLRRMARKTSPAAFRALVDTARELIPNLAITTDVIAGFPGETESEFEESLQFVREMNFTGGHAFTYSARPGTLAASRADQVDPRIRRARTKVYLSHFAAAAQIRARSLVGRMTAVLWESELREPGGHWQLTGHTDDYVRVRAVASESRWNQIDRVKVTLAGADGVYGIIPKSG